MFSNIKKRFGFTEQNTKPSQEPVILNASRVAALGPIQIASSVQFSFPDKPDINAINSRNEVSGEYQPDDEGEDVHIPSSQEVLSRLDEAGLRAQEREYQREYQPEDDEGEDDDVGE